MINGRHINRLSKVGYNTVGYLDYTCDLIDTCCGIMSVGNFEANIEDGDTYSEYWYQAEDELAGKLFPTYTERQAAIASLAQQKQKAATKATKGKKYARMLFDLFEEVYDATKSNSRPYSYRADNGQGLGQAVLTDRVPYFLPSTARFDATGTESEEYKEMMHGTAASNAYRASLFTPGLFVLWLTRVKGEHVSAGPITLNPNHNSPVQSWVWSFSWADKGRTFNNLAAAVRAARS